MSITEDHQGIPMFNALEIKHPQKSTKATLNEEANKHIFQRLPFSCPHQKSAHTQDLTIVAGQWPEYVKQRTYLYIHMLCECKCMPPFTINGYVQRNGSLPLRVHGLWLAFGPRNKCRQINWKWSFAIWQYIHIWVGAAQSIVRIEEILLLINTKEVANPVKTASIYIWLRHTSKQKLLLVLWV